MKISILAVGKLKEKYWKEALAEYVRRLSAFAKVEIIELLDRDASGGSPRQVTELEGADILKNLPADSYVIALDSRGKVLSSEALSAHIDELKLRGKSKITFVIGGSNGLSGAVFERSDESLSFGAVTWPHNMMRVMLAEQIYRACAISANHPYHK
jgi:23S rRNA (pseudouridine1915-N3)-methyltransferase